MNTKIISTLIFVAGAGTAMALADNATSAPVNAQPPTSDSRAPDQTVYVAQLPSVTTLTNSAAAQKQSVKQIVQSDREISVTYQLADGNLKTISYQLLPTADGSSAGVALSTAPNSPSSAPSTVVVYPPLPAYVYTYDPFYSDWWYPAVGVRLGVNFGYHARPAHAWSGFRGHWR